MLGAIIIVFVLLVGIPLAVLMSTPVIAAVLGWSLQADGEERHEGSELIPLNR